MNKKLKASRDSVTLVKENPGRYLGDYVVLEDYLSSLIASDAEVLLQLPIYQFNNDNYYFILGKNNWLDNKDVAGSDWKGNFSKLILLPERGDNAIRHEVFLMAYVDNIIVIEGGRLFKIKGSAPLKSELELLEEEMKRNNCEFAIGFSKQ